MMARGPAAPVLRAIESARPFVDSVCLVVAPGDPLEDIELPIPGRIVRQRWLGYAATRTVTLRHVETDPAVEWVVMIDACAVLRGRMPILEDAVDAYEIAVESNFLDGRWRWMRRGHLMRARRGLRWEGAIHECLVVPDESRVRRWHGLVHDAVASGGRPYDGDVAILRGELDRDPTNTRAAFYYAQSLKDADRTLEALAAFQARATMGGFSEEVFWAWLWAGKLAACLGLDTCVDHFLAAHEHSPDRAEPLAYLRSFYRKAGDPERARECRDAAAEKAYPMDARLFVDVGCYSEAAREAAGID